MHPLRPQMTEEMKKKVIDYEKRHTKIREYLKKEEVERNNKRTRGSKAELMIENATHEEYSKFLTEKNDQLRRRWSACRERVLKNMTVKKWTFVKDGKYDISYLLSGGARRTDLHRLTYNNGLQVASC